MATFTHKDVMKIGNAAAILAGTTLIAFNIIAFTADKYGLYFRDDNQYWLAAGVGLLTVSWLIRNWRQI